jgi:hypothetical protein
MISAPLKGPPRRTCRIARFDIAQEAVLPALKHTESSELAALVIGDGEKLEALSRK